MKKCLLLLLLISNFAFAGKEPVYKWTSEPYFYVAGQTFTVTTAVGSAPSFQLTTATGFANPTYCLTTNGPIISLEGTTKIIFRIPNTYYIDQIVLDITKDNIVVDGTTFSSPSSPVTGTVLLTKLMQLFPKANSGSAASGGTSKNADSLGSHPPAYYATASQQSTNTTAIATETTNRINADGAKLDTANAYTYYSVNDFYGAGTTANPLKSKGKADSATTAAALVLKAPSGVDSIRVLTANPTTGNVYVSSIDNRLHYKSGTNWYRLSVQDSATTVVGPTLTTLTTTGTVNGTFVESPAGQWGSGTGDAVWNKSVASGQDGWIQSDIPNLTNSEYSVIGMAATNTIESYGTFRYGAWVDASNLLSWVDNGTVTHGTVPALAGDKIRVSRIGTTVTADYLRGGNWTTFHTMSLTSTGIAYLKASIAVSPNYIFNPKGANVQ